jgi:hypothetical protein
MVITYVCSQDRNNDTIKLTVLAEVYSKFCTRSSALILGSERLIQTALTRIYSTCSPSPPPPSFCLLSPLIYSNNFTHWSKSLCPLFQEDGLFLGCWKIRCGGYRWIGVLWFEMINCRLSATWIVILSLVLYRSKLECVSRVAEVPPIRALRNRCFYRT